MEISKGKVNEYARRIMISRMRLLCNNGFYGLLLMHTKVSISEEHETAWADMKERIFINPQFMEALNDRELDYVMLHEIMHIVLKHMNRMVSFDKEDYNIAADIVVNSNIMHSFGDDESSISIEKFGGAQMHNVPNGDEGYKYTVEEVYEMIKSSSKDQKDTRKGKGGSKAGPGDGSQGNNGTGNDNGKNQSWDYHPDWYNNGESEDDLVESEAWKARILQAAEAVRIRQSQKTRGLIPLLVQRYIDDLRKPQTDWRTVLNEFVQEEVNDYSFCPPDRRFDDSPFFLPDFNEKDDKVEKILFMIDTSGSMSDEEVTQCYSEIKGAIDQFNGRLEGWLGFFDAEVVEPKPFSDEDEFLTITPSGGGGTSFAVIFKYVKEHMMDDLPVSIVVLTDGYAPFPDITVTLDIPVLWIINNEKNTPPWGKVARINVEG